MTGEGFERAAFARLDEWHLEPSMKDMLARLDRRRAARVPGWRRGADHAAQHAKGKLTARYERIELP